VISTHGQGAQYGLIFDIRCREAKHVKSSRGKLLGVLVLCAALSAIGGMGWEADREVRQQALDSALLSAIKKNDIPEVVASLAKGADPNVRDLPTDTRSVWRHVWDRLRGKRLSMDDRPTALLSALAGRGAWQFAPENVPLVIALLNAGADVNVSVRDGMTPLMWATVSKKWETVRLLLERGADVNARQSDGETPLSVAARSGNTAGVKLLLSRGAQATIVDHNGLTALSYAQAIHHVPIVRMLRGAGATE
jgi:hypothetical protein